MDLLLQENQIRGAVFFTGLFLFWSAGVLLPYRSIDSKIDWFRWGQNMVLIFSNSFLLKFLFPISIAAVAVFFKNKGLGLFNLVDIPTTVKVILSLLLLDLIIYWQHRIFHRVSFLWKLHKVHHTDINFDTTTALRFHPIEIFLSLLVKIFFILIFGFDAVSIILFEIILNFSAMFNHSNISLPGKLESFTRHFIVTPKFHRIHHSTVPKEAHSNFGFCLSIWDFIFKSHTKKTLENDKDMKIGWSDFREKRDQRLDQLLLQPFRKKN